MSWAALSISIAVFLVLAAPVAAGVFMLRRSRLLRVAEACCGGCRYPVSATLGTSPRCPECGALFTEVGVLAPRSRGRAVPVVAWSLILLPLLLCGLMLGTSALAYRRAAAERAAAVRQAAAAQQAAAALRPADATARTAAEPARESGPAGEQP